MGQPIAEGAAPDSRNYLNTLIGTDNIGRDYIIEASPTTLSVYDGTWHYISPCKAPAYNKLTDIELGNAPHEQLYNLKEDIGEQHNVAEQFPDVVSRLKEILNEEEKNEE